ncbi:unnamed protein product [Amoebophrya sp. A120]|nr:unnamed protein product [Amoebophrya sp. A120]|eukprot:GSA120T00011856001.1
MAPILPQKRQVRSANGRFFSSDNPRPLKMSPSSTSLERDLSSSLNMLWPWKWLPSAADATRQRWAKVTATALNGTSKPTVFTAVSLLVVLFLFSLPFILRVSKGTLSRENPDGLFVFFGFELYDRPDAFYSHYTSEKTYLLEEQRDAYEQSFQNETYQGALRRDGVEFNECKTVAGSASASAASSTSHRSSTPTVKTARALRKRSSIKLAYRTTVATSSAQATTSSSASSGASSSASSATVQNEPASLCSDAALEEIWRFDDWLRNWRSSKNFQWNPDFCPTATDAKFKRESCLADYKQTCGAYKPGTDKTVAHEVCKSGFTTHQCHCKAATSTAANTCRSVDTILSADVGSSSTSIGATSQSTTTGTASRTDTKDLEMLRNAFLPSRQYCEIDPTAIANLECTDRVRDPRDGKLYSSLPCSPAVGAKQGEPVDQVGPGYWCGKRAFISPVAFHKRPLIELDATSDYWSTYRSVIDSAAYSQVLDRGLPSSSPPAMVQYAEAKVFVSQLVPDIMLKADRVDERPSCFKDKACLKHANQCPTAALVLRKFPNATGEITVNGFGAAAAKCPASATAATSSRRQLSSSDSCTIAASGSAVSVADLGVHGISSCANVTVEHCLRNTGTSCDFVSSSCRKHCDDLLAQTCSAAPDSFCGQFSNEADPGSQDKTLCESLTNQQSCSASGCQWVSTQMLTEIGRAGTEQAKCVACKNHNNYFQIVASLLPAPASSCAAHADPCACVASLPGVDFCGMPYAAVDFCPQLCAARPNSCANVAASGFVEVAKEQELAGNQHKKTCDLYHASETNCKKAGCSWQSTWDRGNLDAGGHDFAASGATKRCFPCENLQKEPYLKDFAGLAVTPCATSPDPCACLAPLASSVCAMTQVQSWWMCPHLCPQHATSCANVQSTGFEELPRPELAVPGSQSPVHCGNVLSATTSAAAAALAGPLTDMTMIQNAIGLCLLNGCTYVAAPEIGQFTALGLDNTRGGHLTGKCSTCMDRGDLAQIAAKGMGFDCAASACCAMLQQNGGCTSSTTGPRLCPVTCAASPLSCANQAATTAYVEPNFSTTSLLQRSLQTHEAGSSSKREPAASRISLQLARTRLLGPRRAENAGSVFEAREKNLVRKTSTTTSTSNVCDCCTLNMQNPTNQADTLGRKTHIMAAKKAYAVKNCSFWLGWMQLRSKCEANSVDFQKITNNTITLKEKDEAEWLEELSDLYEKEETRDQHFRLQIQNGKYDVEVLMTNTDLQKRDLQTALLGDLASWRIAVEICIVWLLTSVLLWVYANPNGAASCWAACENGEAGHQQEQSQRAPLGPTLVGPVLVPFFAYVTSAGVFLAMLGVSAIPMFEFDDLSPIGILDGDVDGEAETMLPLTFLTLMLVRLVLVVNLLWSGQIYLAAVNESRRTIEVKKGTIVKVPSNSKMLVDAVPKPSLLRYARTFLAFVSCSIGVSLHTELPLILRFAALQTVFLILFQTTLAAAFLHITANLLARYLASCSSGSSENSNRGGKQSTAADELEDQYDLPTFGSIEEQQQGTNQQHQPQRADLLESRPGGTPAVKKGVNKTTAAISSRSACSPKQAWGAGEVSNGRNPAPSSSSVDVEYNTKLMNVKSSLSMFPNALLDDDNESTIGTSSTKKLGFTCAIVARIVLLSVFLPFAADCPAEMLRLDLVDGTTRRFLRAASEGLAVDVGRGTSTSAQRVSGIPSKLTLYLPPSSIGAYHKQANREYFMNFVREKLLKHEKVSRWFSQTQIHSWLFDFEAMQRGRDFSPNDWSSAAQAYPISTCPLILEKTNEFQEVLITSGSNAGKLAALRTRLQSVLVLENLGKVSSNRGALTSSSSAANTNATTSSSQLIGLKMEIPTSEEQAVFGAAVNTASPPAEDPANPFRSAYCKNKVAKQLSSWNLFEVVLKRKTANPLLPTEKVLFSQLPKSQSEEFRDKTTVDEFLQAVAQTWPETEFDVSFRFLEKTTPRIKGGSLLSQTLRDNFLKQQRQTCELQPNLYQERVEYFDTSDPFFFYDYLHTVFEEFKGGVCADNSETIPDSLIDRRVDNEPVGKLRLLSERREEVFYDVLGSEGATATTQGSTNGTSASVVTADSASASPIIRGVTQIPVHLYLRVDMLNPQNRVELKNDIEWILEAERRAYPNHWGRSSQDSFFHADFLIDAERDLGLKHSADDAFLVASLVLGITLFFFLHPAFGAILGCVIAMSMAELVGLMELLDLQINMVTLAALFLSFGIQLIYCLPIAESFVNEEAGCGGETTSNRNGGDNDARSPAKKENTTASLPLFSVKRLPLDCRLCFQFGNAASFPVAILVVTVLSFLIFLGVANSEVIRGFYLVLTCNAVLTALNAFVFLPTCFMLAKAGMDKALSSSTGSKVKPVMSGVVPGEA